MPRQLRLPGSVCPVPTRMLAATSAGGPPREDKPCTLSLNALVCRATAGVVVASAQPNWPSVKVNSGSCQAHGVSMLVVATGRVVGATAEVEAAGDWVTDAVSNHWANISAPSLSRCKGSTGRVTVTLPRLTVRASGLTCASRTDSACRLVASVPLGLSSLNWLRSSWLSVSVRSSAVAGAAAGRQVARALNASCPWAVGTRCGRR